MDIYNIYVYNLRDFIVNKILTLIDWKLQLSNKKL